MTSDLDSPGAAFLHALERKAGILAKRARETVATHGEICMWLLDPLARWAQAAYGDEVFDAAARGYAQYCMHVAVEQRAYEQRGRYAKGTLAAIDEQVYQNETYMTPYMWATMLIYAFWPAMVSHLRLYRSEFLERLPQDPSLLELACGHGVLGLLAVHHRPDARLLGLDLSPAAVDIARRLAAASERPTHTAYEVRDVLDETQAGEAGAQQGVIAALLAEHLTEPRRLFSMISHHLAPDGLAFVSAALESPQKDHVYEFHHESELIHMAEEVGLRASRVVSDAGTGFPAGRFLPRAMAMVLERR